MLEGDDRRRMTRAGAVRIGARKRVPVSVSATTTGKGPLARVGHLGERDAAPTGLEILGRGAYVSPSFSPPIPPFMLDATVDLEPMSATLTTKRKSARDRPASCKERVGDGGRDLT